MANIKISALTAAISLTGAEELEIVQAGVSKRTTVNDVASLGGAGGGVPTTRAINTSAGLSGGGTLASDLTLALDVNGLTTKTQMVAADYFAITDSAAGFAGRKTTFQGAMAAIAGLTHKAIPLATDLVPIYSAADTAAAYSTVSEVLASAGSLPAGGTTGQPLIKQSGTNYDTVFATLPVAGGGTGQITLTDGGLLVGNGTAGITQLAVAAAGTVLTGVAGSDPAFSATPTLGIAGSVIGTLTLAGNTSGGATITPQAAAGTPVLTLPNTTGTFAVGATAPLVLDAASGNLTITGSALTRTNDTNVTLTLGGTPATALLVAASLTLGWTGTLAMSRGGAGGSLTASNGGIVYSDASALQVLAGTATAGQILRSGLSSAPSWSTATYPATAAGGTMLAAGSLNTVTATATPTLGVAGSLLGTLSLCGNTSGTVVITPQAAAGAVTLTLPNTTGTIAASATAPITLNATTGAIGVTGSALTKTDDTNVTLSLGGTPTTALLAATSLTLGWTGQLGLTRGGTAASLTASNGGLVYSTGSALAILSGTATAGQIPRSGSSAAPSWSTSTFPATSAAGTILASLTANTFTASSAPVLGIAGTTIGTLSLCGNTSGTVLITPQAAAGSITLTLPNTAGTLAASATAPITLNATTGAIGITGSALTKTDDTNVTLTLGGTPTTALLAAASLTLGWTGQLAVTRGGTGLSSLTAGDILYASAANTLSALAKSTSATRYLSNTGASNIPAWAQIDLSNGVTGDLPFANMVQIATASFVGRTTASTGDMENLTATQATAILNAFVGDSGAGGTKGLVPAPAAGDAAANKFLKSDGTWASPSGSGDVVGPASSVSDALAVYSGTTGKLLKDSGILSQATTTAKGAAELATDAEAQAKSDTVRTLTPSNLAALSASTTFVGLTEMATAAEYLANSATVPLSLSPAQVWTAAAEVTLTDAATIAVDMSTFINAVVTLAGNRAMGNPTNEKVGQSGYIRIVQDATGSRTLSYGTDWEFAGGTAPVLSTTANAQDMLFYTVIATDRILGSLVKAIA